MIPSFYVRYMIFILALMTQISIINLNSARPYNLQPVLTFQKRV